MKRREFIKCTSIVTVGLPVANLYGFSDVQGSAPFQTLIAQRKSQLDVIAEADLLVIGGSSAGIAAAVKAAENGASVFLVASEPYLGYDICGMFRFWDLNKGAKTSFGQSLFKDGQIPEPAHVKRKLQEYLVNGQINFLLSTYASGIILDKADEISGVVIANRSGEQIIKTKLVIDATESALVARLLGCPMRASARHKSEYRFTVVGNSVNKKLKHRQLPNLVFNGKEYPVTEYQFLASESIDRIDKLQELEQSIRDKTWDANQVDSSDILFEVSSKSIVGRSRQPIRFRNVSELSVSDFQPSRSNRLFILNGYANIDFRDKAEILLPGNMIAIGEMLGNYIGRNREMYAHGTLSRVLNREGVVHNQVNGIISNRLNRSVNQMDLLNLDTETIPVIGMFDNVIVGGGTAGACAAISSARYGSKTLVIEYLHGLGGMGTMGLIGRYWVGYREGFTKEVDEGVAKMGAADHPRQRKRRSDWVKDWKMEWYRCEIQKAGGKVWFGAIACGAIVEGDTVKGVIISTPYGKGAVMAKNTIDSTGSADIAIAAGAPYEFVNADSMALQGSGLPKVNPDDHYNNSDYTFTDDTDVFDITRTFVSGTTKYKNAYDIGKLPQTRERRRIIGDYTVTAMDMANGRFYDDTISYHYSSFDTHGYTVDPYFIIKPPADHTVDLFVNVPLRALLPKGLKHIIVTGLGTSAERDAMPIIRMQPCLQNQGYSVGYIAAMANQRGVCFRGIDISSARKELIRHKILPDVINSSNHHYPPSEQQIRDAVRALTINFDNLEIILWDKASGLKILKEEYDAATNPEFRKCCAVILGFYGYGQVSDDLIQSIGQYPDWDKGWNFRGMHQFGMSASFLDALVMALGKTRDHKGFTAIRRLAEKLTFESELSHFRAVSEAFADLKSTSAIPILYQLLTMPGVSGYSVNHLKQEIFNTRHDVNDNTTRNNSLRELFLARALFVCGDFNNLGRNILQRYANDLHGLYSIHAMDVLKRYS